jgi:hypothetical protein
MSRRLPLCVAVCLVALAAPAVADDPKPPSDAEIKALLIGQWVQEIPGQGGTVGKGYTTYKKDGTFVGKAVVTFNGQTLFTINLSGTWKVTDGTIIETVLQSDDPQGQAKGRVSKDKVLAISKKGLKVRSEKGKESALSRVAD